MINSITSLLLLYSTWAIPAANPMDPMDRAAGPNPVALAQRLPSGACAAVISADVSALAHSLDHTAFGQLLDDPKMGPFMQNFFASMEEMGSGEAGPLRMIFSQVTTAEQPPSAVAVALIAGNEAEGTKPAVVALAIYEDNATPGVIVENSIAELKHKGRTFTSVTIAGKPASSINLPEGSPFPASILMADGSLLLLATGEAAATASLAPESPLADLAAFQSTAIAAAKESGPHAARIMWYAEPLPLMKALQVIDDDPPEERKKEKNTLALLEKQGFGSFQAVGGVIDLASGDMELRHHTKALAPVPYEGAMGMIAPSDRIFPAGHFNANAPVLIEGSWHLRKSFDHFAPLFDALYAEGEEGVFESVVESIHKDKDGPGVDLRGDLFDQLDGQVSLFVEAGPSEPRHVWGAVGTKDASRVTKALHGLFAGDPGAKRIEVAGTTLWSVLASMEDLQGNAPADAPRVGLVVVKDKLLLTNEPSRLAKLLEQPELLTTTAPEVGHQFEQLEKAIADKEKGGFVTVCVDLQSEFRPTYDAARAGEIEQCPTYTARLITRWLKRLRKSSPDAPSPDGKLLPEFAAVQHYLGQFGLFGKTTETGWDFRGVILVPQTQPADKEN